MEVFKKLPFEVAEFPVSFGLFLERALELRKRETPSYGKGSTVQRARDLM